MMHTTMKTLASLACLAALVPSTSPAHMVKAPHVGTVTNTTYYASGAFHGAVDVASGFGCAGDDVRSPMPVYWTIQIASTTTQCSNPVQNEARHLFADGWTFRVMHFLRSSVIGSCTDCVLGKTSNHTHLQYDKSGTLDTSWYAGYTSKGEYLDLSETVGYVD